MTNINYQNTLDDVEVGDTVHFHCSDFLDAAGNPARTLEDAGISTSDIAARYTIGRYTYRVDDVDTEQGTICLARSYNYVVGAANSENLSILHYSGDVIWNMPHYASPYTTICNTHNWVQTGTLKSYCKTCDCDGIWDSTEFKFVEAIR